MIVNCPHPQCTVDVQRTPGGDLQDGLDAHYKTVHRGDATPIIRQLIPKESS